MFRGERQTREKKNRQKKNDGFILGRHDTLVAAQVARNCSEIDTRGERASNVAHTVHRSWPNGKFGLRYNEIFNNFIFVSGAMHTSFHLSLRNFGSYTTQLKQSHFVHCTLYLSSRWPTNSQANRERCALFGFGFWAMRRQKKGQIRMIDDVAATTAATASPTSSTTRAKSLG